MNEEQIFASVGKEGITKMVAAFYKKVPTDDILGPMYPKDDMDGGEERLRDFLLFRIGGDTAYTEKRGHPRLRMRHVPFHIDSRARDRWMKLMDEAMVEAEIPTDAAKAMSTFFYGVADFLRNAPDNSGPFKI